MGLQQDSPLRQARKARNLTAKLDEAPETVAPCGLTADSLSCFVLFDQLVIIQDVGFLLVEVDRAPAFRMVAVHLPGKVRWRGVAGPTPGDGVVAEACGSDAMLCPPFGSPAHQEFRACVGAPGEGCSAGSAAECVSAAAPWTGGHAPPATTNGSPWRPGASWTLQAARVKPV